MKIPLARTRLPDNSLLILCSSQEDRCLGIIQATQDWSPRSSLLFRYDPMSTRGEDNHATLSSHLGQRTSVAEARLDHIVSRGPTAAPIAKALRQHGKNPLVLDISVMSKRYLFVLLRWLDDHGYWDRLWILYSEPEVYGTEGHIPLSFGVASVTHLPGFTSVSNPSRRLHAVLFLGYEGDRALATYEFLQPTKTTVVVPDPPFRPSWSGRTEVQNRNLLATIDSGSSLVKTDALDPVSTYQALCKIFGEVTSRSDYSRALCPLGTKPQVVGSYMYLRECLDPPAVMYSWVLRHNDHYYSRGIGNRWIIHRPQ